VVVIQVSVVFSKIEGECELEHGEPVRLGKQRIEVNTRITNIELKRDTHLAQDIVLIKFIFTCRDPISIGIIRLGGRVLYFDTQEKMNEIVEKWHVDHRLPQSIEPILLNAILSRATVETVGLSRILQIPPPIPLPSVQSEPPQQGKPGKADFSYFL
jgi:hypothetical protein